MRELQPLRLPQLVQARKLQEASSNCVVPNSPSTASLAQSPQSPTQFELPSPSTPNSALCNYSTSTNCPLPTACDPPDKIMPIKRPLTEVREELDPEHESELLDGKVSGFDRKRK